MLSSSGQSLHHSSQDHYLRLINAVFKTSVHNQPLPDCLQTYISLWLRDSHLTHSSCTYLCSLVFSVVPRKLIHHCNNLTHLDANLLSLLCSQYLLSLFSPVSPACLPAPSVYNLGSLLHWTHPGLFSMLVPPV